MFEDRRIAVFLAFHHGVVDGVGFCDLLTAWLKGAKVAQDPCHDRSLLGVSVPSRVPLQTLSNVSS